MFLVPAVAMRLWAEERRLGTIELLLTLPVTVTDVVLGKFLAAWCFIGIALALTFPLVLTVMYLGNPDLGVIFCAYLGSFLMAGTFLSVGSMTSALTRSQVVSFILAVVACLFLILAGFAPVTAPSCPAGRRCGWWIWSPRPVCSLTLPRSPEGCWM
jgi:ABC-2 type transport system permease protein